MLITAAAAAWGICILLLLLMCKSKAGTEYAEYLEYIDKKEYSLKDMFPAGFYFIDSGLAKRLKPKAISRKLSRYNNKVAGKIIELHGDEYKDFYIQVHEANKFVLSCVAAIIFALLSIVMGTGGDGTNAAIFLLVSVGAMLGLGFLLDKSLDSKIEKRRSEIRMEFPEFVDKLTLLVDAGMTISKAWEKITADNKKEGPLYDELLRAGAEISAGKPEAAAYEDFGKRCKIKEIMKFVSVIVLNLKKGGAEVVPTLRVQGNECWEMRKAEAKRLGEEASSKIMLPLMMMFIGIIIIVATPAILSFSQGF